MPQTAAQLGFTTPPGGFQEGSFIQGRQFIRGTFGEIGAIHPDSPQQGAGQRVSAEVVRATDPANLSFIESQIKAEGIRQAPSVALPSRATTSIDGLQSQVDTARSNLEATLSARKTEVDARLEALRSKEQAVLKDVGVISTPFREDLEKTERERLFVNQNFEENQVLINELDDLLTEGNDLIRQQEEVTGLSAVRNPRIQKTMNDVNARVGVIEAIINARNGQIAQANNLIDRSIKAINADRQDQLTYYETILNLNNRDIISLDKESKDIAQEQVSLLKGDLENAQATQDYVKQLMLDPESAQLMGEAGVSLNDSIQDINFKISEAQYAREVRNASNQIALEGGVAVVDPGSVPTGKLITITDSRGVVRYYEAAPDKKTGGGFGTVANKISLASKQDASFPQFVVSNARLLELGDIYEAYSKSPRGIQFGNPQEDSRAISALYFVSRGEITPEQGEKVETGELSLSQLGVGI